MKQVLQTSLDWFFKAYQFPFQTYWFKKALYLFVGLKAVAWLCFYELYFGSNAIVYSNYFLPHTFRDAAFLLYSNPSSVLSYFFIIPVFCLCLFAFKFDKYNFIADLLIWFLIININNKIYPTLTGGDYLLNQFLFFNCWLRSAHKTNLSENWRSDLQKFFHNTAIVAVIVHVCVVYFLSALAKCFDENWMSGSALDQINSVHHFRLFSASLGTSAAFAFSPLMNYLIVGYQMLFPILIWIKKIKKLFICFGILMHLYIAVVMGLMEFGTIMLIAYIYFWPFKKTIP
jgi:hypothetical protein